MSTELMINILFIFLYYIFIGLLCILFSKLAKYLFKRYLIPLEEQTQLFLSSSVFAFLGFTIGFMSGLSRISATGSVLSAILTLIGGFTLYLFVTDKFKGENRLQAVFSIFLLTLWLPIGSAIGSYHRVAHEDFEIERQYKHEFDLLWYEKQLELEYSIISRDSTFENEDFPEIDYSVPKEPGDPDDE